MVINNHTNKDKYLMLVDKNKIRGIILSESNINRVLELSQKYIENGDELDFMDFLGDDEYVEKQIGKAEETLSTRIKKKQFEQKYK